METFGQLRIRLSVCTGHLCPTSAAKAESPGFRFFFLYESRRKARQFCKVKHLREQHVRGRMRVHIHLVREELQGGMLGGDLEHGTAPLLTPKPISTYASIYCSHDYGGSCLLLVKFRLLCVLQHNSSCIFRT